MSFTDLTKKYYLKNGGEPSYTDVTTKFNGVRILSISGVTNKGKAVNVYNEQWITSDVEDFLITSNNGAIVRTNEDIEVNFIVSRRYADSQINAYDVQEMTESFLEYMLSSDVWIKDMYVNRIVHCVSLDGYEPQTIKLHRGDGSTYILGKIKMHMLQLPISID